MNHRQQLIAAILDQHDVTSQTQLVELLAEQGIAVTQATVSRDLDRLGAVRVRRGGHMVYALPAEELPVDPIDRAARGARARPPDRAVGQPAGHEDRSRQRPAAWPGPSTSPTCPRSPATSAATTPSSWSPASRYTGADLQTLCTDILQGKEINA